MRKKSSKKYLRLDKLIHVAYVNAKVTDIVYTMHLANLAAMLALCASIISAVVNTSQLSS